jgi:TRAP-type C4-dicarboxylate transport system permease small subunit
MSELKQMDTGPTWLRALTRIDTALYNLEKYLLILIGILLTGSALLEVVLRYVFNSTLLVGISELQNWAFVWLVAIGCASLVKTKRHMSVEFLINKLPIKLRKVIMICSSIFLMIFFIYVIGTGVDFAIQQWAIKTTAANIPKTWLYLSIPGGMVLMLIHLGIQTLQKITGYE